MNSSFAASANPIYVYKLRFGISIGLFRLKISNQEYSENFVEKTNTDTSRIDIYIDLFLPYPISA